jgi:hypothetical protein
MVNYFQDNFIRFYPERWRDWPYEARQPIMTVPIPAGEIPRDKEIYMPLSLLERGFFIFWIEDSRLHYYFRRNHT